MRRRRIICSWVLLLSAGRAAQAQPRKIPTIGILVPSNPEFYRTFPEALRHLGYVEGSSIRIEFRSADGKPERLAPLARELVQLGIDVLVAFQTPAVQAAKDATTTIPIVMSSGDPVGTGLVASLARPGGNITGFTGFTAELGGKRLELLRDMLPSLRRVVVLANPADPFTPNFVQQMQSASRTLGLSFEAISIRGDSDFEAVFRAMAADRPGAVILQPSLPVHRAVELALEHRIALISEAARFLRAGGLMSFGASVAERDEVVAAYVDKVLKGARPADLPIVQATRLELRINLRTARALGLQIPQAVLDRADEVIE